MSDFLGELRRRRAIRVAGIYLVAGWVAIQAADTLAPLLLLPGWVARAVAFLTILGFPLAVALAWAFQLTPEGVRRTAPSSFGSRLLPVSILGIVLVGTGAAAYVRYGTASSEPLDSIAVLPFTDLSSTHDQEYLGDGIAEELLNALNKVADLQVAARTSAFAFKNQNADIKEIGQKLGVDAVLEGSVRKEGNRLRITAQLIRSANGYHLWSETYERELSGVFQLQDEISRSILNALRLQLGSGQKQLVRTGTQNVQAYELYLKGRFYWLKQRPETLEQARQFFQQALDLDPSFALAHVMLSAAYVDLASEGDREQNIARGRAALNRALALDPELPAAHGALAFLYDTYDFNFVAAENEYRKALEVDANLSVTLHDFAQMLAALGRFDEALVHARRAAELDPLTPWISSGVGRVLTRMGRYDEALRELEKAQALEPMRARTQWDIARAYSFKGTHDLAVASAERAQAMDAGRKEFGPHYPAYIYARAGRTAEATKLLLQLEQEYRDEELSFTTVAMAYVALGRMDDAFRWLERAYQNRDNSIIGLLHMPETDRLRQDARFAPLVKRIGLPNQAL
ncbi:MAG: tetratricopeptide repeat protein [Longimicrobiales bacterium]